MIALAVDHGERGDDLEGIRQLVWRAVQSDPSSALAWLWLARVEAAMGDARQSAQVGRQAVQIAVVSNNANLNNDVCWSLSLIGSAGLAMPACEATVRLRPKSVSYRDSRGLARAMTGDRAGAIEDFRAFVAAAEDRESVVAERKRWIELLEKGESPFDAAQRKQLIGARF